MRDTTTATEPTQSRNPILFLIGMLAGVCLISLVHVVTYAALFVFKIGG